MRCRGGKTFLGQFQDANTASVLSTEHFNILDLIFNRPYHGTKETIYLLHAMTS